MTIEIPDALIARIRKLTGHVLDKSPSGVTDSEVRLAIIGDLELSTWRRESDHERHESVCGKVER